MIRKTIDHNKHDDSNFIQINQLDLLTVHWLGNYQYFYKTTNRSIFF